MKKIKRTKLYEEVIKQIQNDIKSQKLKPGDRLPTEKELSKMYGVSKMTVREAMSALESAGLIQVRHGSGIFLNDINEKVLIEPLTLELLKEKNNLFNLLELRKGIESEAAYLAAIRASNDDIKNIQKCLQKMKKDIDKENIIMHDFNYHYAIVIATKNPVYIKAFKTITGIFQQGLKVTFKYLHENQENYLKMIDEHTAVFECLESRNSKQARLAMYEHLEKVRIRMMQAKAYKKSTTS